MSPYTPGQIFTLLLCSVFTAHLGVGPAFGQPAEPFAAFAESLALRTDRIVADSDRATIGWLTQTRPAAYAATGALRLTLALAPWEGDPRPVKELGSFTVYGGDLANSPFPFRLELRGVPDGYYRYVAEVWDGATSLVKLLQPVVLVAGLESRHAEFAQRLAKINGHESTKASVLYPFDLARVINLGKRVHGSGVRNPEFGLSEAGVEQLYDFVAGLKQSGEWLAALEKGRDPLWRTGGDHVRHHYLESADEILPYRVFVPSTWDGRSTLPLVFVLHGNTRDHNFYLDRDGRIIPQVAEKHGFMVVAPLGYSPNGGFNYVPFNRERGARGVAAAQAARQQYGAPPAAAANAAGGEVIAGGVNGSVTPALIRAEWSEQDTMRVFELVKQEYPIDPKRTFLFGYSAGGQGAHYLGQKFAGNWAAIAIGGSNAAPGPHYDFERFKDLPMFLFSGVNDPVLNATRTMAEALQQKGAKAVFKEYPGIDHATAPGAATPDIFAFFAANGRK